MIRKIFGNPCIDDGSIKAKFARFIYYWLAIFCIIVIVMCLTITLFNFKYLPITIIIVVGLPWFVKIFYSFLINVNSLKRED